MEAKDYARLSRAVNRANNKRHKTGQADLDLMYPNARREEKQINCGTLGMWGSTWLALHKGVLKKAR
jgi:hypothetical protein